MDTILPIDGVPVEQWPAIEALPPVHMPAFIVTTHGLGLGVSLSAVIVVRVNKPGGYVVWRAADPHGFEHDVSRIAELRDVHSTISLTLSDAATRLRQLMDAAAKPEPLAIPA